MDAFDQKSLTWSGIKKDFKQPVKGLKRAMENA